MSDRQPEASAKQPIAILAGSGDLPAMAAAAALRAGRHPIVFLLPGSAGSAAFPGLSLETIRWGEVGKFWNAMAKHGCREAVFIGAVTARPSLNSLRPDLGALFLMPRIVKLMRRGDDGLLSGIARIFEERGMTITSVVDVAPELVLPEGLLTRRRPSGEEMEDIAKAAEAVDAIGALDIGQAAICVDGRVVALEGAEGTDALMERVQSLRSSGRVPQSGGVLVKRPKPGQDQRFDLPTLGPVTALRAREAGLAGVAAEAGGTLLAGREETISAFDDAGLFLLGLPEASFRKESMPGV
jgi:UDP-2,3-diacylglucosamine hydrolase